MPTQLLLLFKMLQVMTHATFNTDDEKIVFGKIFEAQTASKIGILLLLMGQSQIVLSASVITLTTSGLASLDGGIDVNGEVFTVSNLGATVIKNTLTLNNAGSTSDLDVQANGTSVFKVDVSTRRYCWCNFNALYE